jgi:hypothetical protein
MKEVIKQNLENPEALESLYRKDKSQFKNAFQAIYPDIENTLLAKFWQNRLNYSSPSLQFGNKSELLFVLILVVLAGIVAKIPDFIAVEQDLYYQRNVSFIVFPSLILLFARFNQLAMKPIIILFALIISSAIFINFIPFVPDGDTLILSAVHLTLILWFTLGYVHSHQDKDKTKRIDFLRFNGDLIVMSVVIVLAGVLLVLMTVGLFELINVRLTDTFYQNIAIWGLPAVPVVASFLIQKNPDLVKNVSPVIAKIFTPLILVMLSFYVVALLLTENDPYNDRNALLTFNLLLVGVLAVILFSVVSNDKGKAKWINHLLLLGVSILTLVINGIALSAIVFRISEWGLTPNRLTVLGFNLLILIHLIKVSYTIFYSLKDESDNHSVSNSISSYLPVYAIWAIFITFVLPLIFSFE